MPGVTSLVAVLADLSEEYGWPPDAWRRLTVREFLAWARELQRRRIDRARVLERSDRGGVTGG